MTDISPSHQGNATFVANDYATTRSLYTHVMTIDQPNIHLYPLNWAIENLKFAISVAFYLVSMWHLFFFMQMGRSWNWRHKNLELSPHNLKVLSPCQKTEFISVRELTNRPDVIDWGGDSTYAAQELKKLKARLHLCCLLIATMPAMHLRTFTLRSQKWNQFFRDSEILQKGAGSFTTVNSRGGCNSVRNANIFFRTVAAPERHNFSSFEARIRNLSPDSPGHFDHFLSLHNSHTECSCFLNLAVGIYGTNSFALTDDNLGIWSWWPWGLTIRAPPMLGTHSTPTPATSESMLWAAFS